LDAKWGKYLTEDVVDDVLFEEPFTNDVRDPYMPESDCTQSASKGVHAFIFDQLSEALKAAPESSAVADFGSGTGFMLKVFRWFVHPRVDVVGVENDHSAVEHAWRLLPEDVKVLEKDVFDFSYPKKFSVINVGFASEDLPKRLLDITAEDATILMPICTQPLNLLGNGQKCDARYRLFKKTLQDDGTGFLVQSEEVGPRITFFYVALGGDKNALDDDVACLETKSLAVEDKLQLERLPTAERKK
jgi:protein-L-isoaspartate O-methyltransferase